MNQIIAKTVRHRCQGAHAARHDGHAHRDERSAGDRRALVVRQVRDGRETLHLIDGVRGFVEQGPAAPGADDQM